MTNSQHTTITAPDGWRIEYLIDGKRGFAATFDAKGHKRGGAFNARPETVEEELAWFRREHVEVTERTDR